jgi:hypothetical protein
MAMTRARDFFDAVRDASIDAERCRRQLLQLEARATSLGGGGFGERVSCTNDHDRMGGRVALYVDREEQLRERMGADYAMIDRACVVLYGPDQRTGGMSDEVSSTWADALWWRYCGAETWESAARAVGYSLRQLHTICDSALLWLDETGYAADVMRLKE